MTTKYLFYTGGVVSSVGKGVTAAATGLLLKELGPESVRVTPVFISIDSGRDNPEALRAFIKQAAKELAARPEEQIVVARNILAQFAQLAHLVGLLRGNLHAQTKLCAQQIRQLFLQVVV